MRRDMNEETDHVEVIMNNSFLIEISYFFYFLILYYNSVINFFQKNYKMDYF